MFNRYLVSFNNKSKALCYDYKYKKNRSRCRGKRKPSEVTKMSNIINIFVTFSLLAHSNTI